MTPGECENDEVSDHRALLEQLRPRAFAIAYRMLGSVSEAEDIVQEAMLRVHQTASSGTKIDSPQAFVTTITTRLSITELQSARARRERYFGDWLPEPLITDTDPADRVETMDALSLALLVTLETLSPEQRAALLLHDVFDYDYTQIADVVGTTADNARQLVSRARGRVGDRTPRYEATPESHRELVQRFFAAAEDGDLAGLESLLASGVVMRGDGGGKVPALGRTVLGRQRVAKTLVNGTRAYQRLPGVSIRLVQVNGGPGALYVDQDERILAVVALHIIGQEISSVDAIVNPDKLVHLGPLGDVKALLSQIRD